MFNPFVVLDSIPLGATQKVSDAFQLLTGRTKYTLQKWMLILITGFFGVDCAFSQKPMLGILFLPWVAIVIMSIRALEGLEAKFLKDGELFFSPYYAFEIRFPLAAVYAILIFISEQTMLYAMICMFLYVYFGACIPRPPSKSKMREWYERALTGLNDWLKPAPALVPIPSDQ